MATSRTRVSQIFRAQGVVSRAEAKNAIYLSEVSVPIHKHIVVYENARFQVPCYRGCGMSIISCHSYSF